MVHFPPAVLRVFHPFAGTDSVSAMPLLFCGVLLPGKYGELLGCEDWDSAMPHRIVLANTLFGFPTAYLNPYKLRYLPTRMPGDALY